MSPTEEPGNPVVSGRSRRLARAGWWVILLGWALALTWASSIPGTDRPPVMPHLDKLLHFAAFAVGGAVAERAVGAGRSSAIATILVAAFGLLDEWHQSHVVGRHADGLDAIADAAGALAGALLSRRARGALDARGGRNGRGARDGRGALRSRGGPGAR